MSISFCLCNSHKRNFHANKLKHQYKATLIIGASTRLLPGANLNGGL